jgi:hypothetical protein
MNINSDELGEYVRAVLRGIDTGISEEIVVGDDSEKFSLSGPVKFQLGITNSVEKGGEVKIFVAGLHGGKSSEQNARIEFEVSDSSAAFFRDMDKLVTIWEKLSTVEREAIKAAISLVLQNPTKTGLANE